jgi:hypothetical protein
MTEKLFHFLVVDVLTSFVFCFLLLVRWLLSIKIPLLPVASKLFGRSARPKEQRSDLVDDIQNKPQDEKKLKHWLSIYVLN